MQKRLKLRRHQTPKPMRRCIACRESKPQDELMRFTFDGVRVTADPGLKNDGRGFYLCRAVDHGVAKNQTLLKQLTHTHDLIAAGLVRANGCIQTAFAA